MLIAHLSSWKEFGSSEFSSGKVYLNHSPLGCKVIHALRRLSELTGSLYSE